MKKSLILLPILSCFGLSIINNNCSFAVHAEDVSVTSISIKKDSDIGYDILVGEEVILNQTEFVFLPEDASNKNVEYYLANDSFTGNCPAALFSDESTYSNIIIKGLCVGSIRIYFRSEDNHSATTFTTFRVLSSLPENAQREGLTVYKTPADNGIKEGATSIIQEEEIDIKPTPIYKDDSFQFKAIFEFLGQIIDINFFIIMGISIIGLLFIYVLVYAIRTLIFKSRR